MFEILHFRGSEEILKQKRLLKDVQVTMQYIDDVLTGALYKRELLRMALEEMDWTMDAEIMRILQGRRYKYKGIKRRVAIDGNISAYEYILEGLVRLQIGFDKKRIDAGILIVNSKRSDKSPFGTTADLIKAEIETLHPTIHLPVSVCLFNTGEIIFDEEGGMHGSLSVPPDDNWETEKASEGCQRSGSPAMSPLKRISGKSTKPLKGMTRSCCWRFCIWQPGEGKFSV